jgi:hypothetical protein
VAQPNKREHGNAAMQQDIPLNKKDFLTAPATWGALPHCQRR